MTTRHCISFAIAGCLLLVIPAYGQHAQVDLESETDRLPPQMERLRAALPASIVARISLLDRSADGFVFKDALSTPVSSFGDVHLSKAAVWLLTEQIAQNWDVTANGGAGDWLNENRVSFTRNSAGVSTERLLEDWDADAGAWTTELRTTYTVNAQNRIEETLDEGWDRDANGGQGGWEPFQRVRTTFDGQGNATVRATEFWDDTAGDWFLWNRSTSSYENGRVVQQVFESISFVTGMFGPSLRTSFEYDGAGNTTQRIRETYDSGAEAWKNSSRRQWTYNGAGEETEDLEQTWDESASDWVNDYRELTTSSPTEMVVTAQDWDPAANGGQGDWVNRDRGSLTMTSSTEWVETEQDWDPAANGGQGDWVNRNQQLITLDSNGNFLEFVERTWDPAASGGQGDWVNESRGSFVYNGDGLVTENLIQIWNGAQWVNESRLLQMYQEFTGTAVEDIPNSGYTLEANYPNPFSGETTIRFTLPAAKNVTVEVYDVLGRRVSTLVDEMAAPGNHSVTLHGKEMAGGLYFYRLQSDDVSISRTMLLVK